MADFPASYNPFDARTWTKDNMPRSNVEILLTEALEFCDAYLLADDVEDKDLAMRMAEQADDLRHRIQKELDK